MVFQLPGGTEARRLGRAIETIDVELRLVVALRRAARERSGPLPSIAGADAVLDERPSWTQRVEVTFFQNLLSLAKDRNGRRGDRGLGISTHPCPADQVPPKM
jgi:hypothetical protein